MLTSLSGSQDGPIAAARTPTRGPTWRKRWVAIHRWIGIVIGAFFALLGLTGSINVYRDEIDHLLNPRMFAVGAVAEGALPWSALIERAHGAAPEEGAFARLKVEAGLPRTAIVTLATGERETDVHLDRADGRVLGMRPSGSSFIEIVNRIHYGLLIDAAGVWPAGVIGGGLFVSLISGLYLWWPKRFVWKAALAVDFRGGARRWVYQLHRSAGTLAAIVLCMSCITGLAIVFSAPISSVLGDPMVAQPAGPAAGRFRVDDAGDIAKAAFGDAELRGVYPDPSGTPVLVAARQPGEPGFASGGSMVLVDTATGAVTAKADPLRASPALRVQDWMLPLHRAEPLGPIGRFVLCLSGLVPALLFVTGTVMFSQRRKARKPPQRA